MNAQATSLDTSAEAERVVIDRLRAMSPTQRLRLALWSSQDLVNSSIQVVAEGDADVHQSERRASPVDV